MTVLPTIIAVAVLTAILNSNLFLPMEARNRKRSIQRSNWSFLTSVGIAAAELVLFSILLSQTLSANDGPSSSAPVSFDREKGPDWVQITTKAGWHPRDSQAEFVYRNQLWILGGWFDSFLPTPRDVWSSPNGRDWTLVKDEAPWKHGDLAMGVAFKKKMWLLGGWSNGRLPDHSASNEVWSSKNGADWQLVTPRAGWSPRLAAGVVVFKGALWLMGGVENYYFGDENSYKNDIWRSTNGKKWTLVTPHAGWSPRAYHQVVIFNDQLYLIGGGRYLPNYQAVNDIWTSKDGEHWVQICNAAPWHPRLWYSCVVYRNCLWLLGGWSINPYRNWGDVWYSRDGKNWIEMTFDRIWRARHEYSAFVFNDSIWIAGGHATPLDSEVWSLSLPINWVPQRSDQGELP